jgi:hypothetical protein
MEKTAYHGYLKQNFLNREGIAQALLNDVMDHQNPQAFDLLKETGDEAYTKETFLKAADIVLELTKDIQI